MTIQALKTRLTATIAAERPAVQRFGFALLLLAVAVVIRLALDPLTGSRANWTTFYLVATLAALFGGLMPGLLVVVAAFCIIDYGFIAPRDSFAIDALADRVVAVGFLVVSTFLAAIAALARSTIRQVSVARVEQAHLAAIVASSDDAIVGKDLHGVIRSWNAGAERIFGYTAAEIVGRHISMLVPQGRRDDVNAILERVASGERIEHYETERLCKNGDQIAVSLTVSPIRDATGAVVGASKIARDITDRRAAEAEQHRLMSALRDADRRKDEFLAMLAHELRNPLGPIRNAVEVLQLVGPPEPRLLRAVGMIQRQVTHLTRLVDDLLDVSRITRGTVRLRRQIVDLAEIVDHAVDQVRPAIETKSQSLAITNARSPITLDADPARLIQVVANLIGNASKFTPSGGALRIATELADGQAVIRVSDNGIGIPADLLPRVFDLFVQGLTSADRTQGGLGIGLTLARQLVDLHGGRIEARSAGPGHGSEFTVTLPAVAHSARETERPAVTAEPKTRLAILLVEDNLDTADSFKMLLELNGHTVHAAASGTAALALVEDFSPAVAFIDIGLPGMDGFEVARCLRAHPSCRSTLLVALSGYGTEADQRRSADAGFDHHLIKPVDFTDVTRLLDERVAPAQPAAAARVLH